MRKAFTDTSKGEKNFRWRNPDVSRIENLSDIMFALAIALIATQNAPSSFAELAATWRDIAATGLCFIIILIIWNTHYIFFRRYDVEDGRTVFLNSVLLFLVFSLAYPLKFIMLFVVRLVTLDFDSNAEINTVMSLQQGRILNILYAFAYSSIFGTFALLYRHALGHAEAMALSAKEKILTRGAINESLVHVAVGLLVAIVALVTPPKIAVLTGTLFFLIGPGAFAAHAMQTKALKKLDAAEKE